MIRKFLIGLNLFLVVFVLGTYVYESRLVSEFFKKWDDDKNSFAGVNMKDLFSRTVIWPDKIQIAYKTNTVVKLTYNSDSMLGVRWPSRVFYIQDGVIQNSVILSNSNSGFDSQGEDEDGE